MDNEFKNNYEKMRVGTGVGNILYGNQMNSHHYIDSLERFQKDFTTAQKQRRQQQRQKKQAEIQRKRIEYLERQSRRWENVQTKLQKQQETRELGIQLQRQGIRRTANGNGLPYDPISLQYEKSNEGEKLRTRDEDNKIRGYVRAHNMEKKGNSQYNPITGQVRVAIQKIIPENLQSRFDSRLNEHYDSYKLRVPSSKSTVSNNQRY